MRKRGVAVCVVAGALAAVSCGGGGGGSPVGATPSGSGASSTSVTISIMGVNGKLSFSPNPASVPSGAIVLFKNNDVVTHRVQLDDKSVETTDIAPGATSGPLPLGAVNKSYHCTIHPTMVGSLNGAATPEPPPCTFNYC
jgi:plastocyanin